MSTIDQVSIGWKKETAYGTPVTVDRWMEILGDSDSLDFRTITARGAGLSPSASVARASRDVIVGYDADGGFGVELVTKGMGTLLEACMGVGVSTVVTGATYQQQFTLGAPLPLTIQKGPRINDGSATMAPQTYTGAVAKSLALSVPGDGIATLTPDFDIRTMATATAYASPSIAAEANVYHSLHAGITLGGTVTAPTTTTLASGGTSVANVSAFSMSIDHGLSTSPRKFGSGLKSRPASSKPVPTGTMTIEYDSNTVRDAIIARTTLGLVLTLTSTEALSTGFAQFQVYLPAVKLSGPMPRVTGEVIQQDVSWEAFSDETNPPVVISIRTSDTAL